MKFGGMSSEEIAAKYAARHKREREARQRYDRAKSHQTATFKLPSEDQLVEVWLTREHRRPIALPIARSDFIKPITRAQLMAGK